MASPDGHFDHPARPPAPARRAQHVVLRRKGERGGPHLEREVGQPARLAVAPELPPQPRRQHADLLARPGEERRARVDGDAAARRGRRDAAETERLAAQPDVLGDHLPVHRRRERHPRHRPGDQVLVDAAEDDGRRVAAERREVEGEHVGGEQLLPHDVVEHRHRARRGDRRQAQPDDPRERELLEWEVALVVDLEKRLVGNVEVVKVDDVLRDDARDATGAELDVDRHAARREGGRAAAVEALVHRAARRVAARARHPQVGGARVEDDREALLGRADADGAVVLRVLEVVQRLVEEPGLLLRTSDALQERGGVSLRRMPRPQRYVALQVAKRRGGREREH